MRLNLQFPDNQTPIKTINGIVPNPDGNINLDISDLSNSSVNLGVGTGNLVGGYAVKIAGYNSSTRVLTLDNGGSNSSSRTKMSKFSVGGKIYCSEVEEDISTSTSETWGGFKSDTIQSVDGASFKITLTNGIAFKTTDFTKSIVFVWVEDESRKDAAFSSGDRNLVSGLAASADGLLNITVGTASKVKGALNIVVGNFSEVVGVGNTIEGDRMIVHGGNNRDISASMSSITGNGNLKISGQGHVILGDGNMNTSGVNISILGDGNSGTGNYSRIIGFYNIVSGERAVVIGNNNTVAAKKAIVLGQKGELPDKIENRGAIAFSGGDTTGNKTAISFIHRTHKVDPLDSSNSEIAYSTEYMGRLKGMQLETSNSQVVLDHDMYSRWKLTGSGLKTITLDNWNDGDVGEVVIDTTTQAFSVPNSWIMSDSLWDKWLGNPGTYCLEIRQVGSKVYAYSAVGNDVGDIPKAVSGNIMTRTLTSSNTTAQSGHWYLCSSNVTITLPASSSSGDFVRVSTISTASDVTITPSGTDTIEGQTGFNIDTTHSSVELIYDGTQWLVAEVITN